MKNQHDYATSTGANVPYDEFVASPLDKAIRQLEAEGRRILGFERVGNRWLFKIMAKRDEPGQSKT